MDESKAGKEPIRFVGARGSQVTPRLKDKPERITESLSDLQLVVAGVTKQANEFGDAVLREQTLAAFARACSVFLRKRWCSETGTGARRGFSMMLCRGYSTYGFTDCAGFHPTGGGT